MGKSVRNEASPPNTRNLVVTISHLEFGKKTGRKSKSMPSHTATRRCIDWLQNVRVSEKERLLDQVQLVSRRQESKNNIVVKKSLHAPAKEIVTGRQIFGQKSNYPYK